MSSSEDKYDTLEKIGHGSFGVIRKVRRKTDGFIMCRKEISYLRMSQKEREQLHAEFQILSTLRHPNIVAYYHREHLKISQDLHLYMEYCGNGDLGRVIKDLALKGQRAQESFVWSIFSQLVLALFRCHYGVDPPEVGSNVLGLTQGAVNGAPKVPAGTMTILHRDLKPENVFLGEDNSVKLGDFGLSKMIQSHDFASTYVGTPFYMSPEICAAEKYTLKSDIWSLGCIIYELCAREPPFNAKTHYQLVQKIKDGKVKKLPDVYSPELNQVISDCLMVNPDRRPDTTKLLNLPVVRLMRKEKEVVDLNKSLKHREETLRRKEKEVNEALSDIHHEKEAMRVEIDSQLRREWEVKARLEIDRLTNAEIEHLQKRFEEEVQARVQAELQKKTVSFKLDEEPLPTPEDDFSASGKTDYPHSSVGHSGDDFTSTTDLTEYSVDSPDSSKEIRRVTNRTPFGRAQTMYAGHAGTPMDIEMMSPSPMAIASLSLSPRRGGNVKAPMAHTGNIFATAKHTTSHGDPSPSSALRFRSDNDLVGLVESDDEEDTIPSPTRNIRSTKNPFTSKSRPVLTSQKSCPVNRLRTKASNGGLISKATGLPTSASGNVAASSAPDVRTSPNRRFSKIPSAANLREVSSSPNMARKAAGRNTTNTTASSDEALSNKAGAKNHNVRGRTLVELQQARAGGRPLSVVSNSSGGGGENVSPKRGAFRDRLAAAAVVSANSSTSTLERRMSGGSSDGVAVWDPEKDEMPSPFLVRSRRPVRADS